MKILPFTIACLMILAMLPGFTSQAQPTDDSLTYYKRKAKSFEYVSADSMLYYSGKIYELARRWDSDHYLAIYHGVAGVAYEEMGKYDSALVHQSESLRLAQELADSSVLMLAYHHTAVIHKDLGNYDQALENYLSAVRLAETLRDHYISAMSTLGMAQVYFRLGLREDAYSAITKCIDIGTKAGDNKVVLSALIERGNNLIMAGDLDGALADFDQADALIRQTNHTEGYVHVLNSIGAIYFYKNDFNRAIDYYRLGKAECLKYDDLINLGISYQNIGEAYIYLKQYDLAYENLSEGVRVHKSHGNKGFIASGYQYLHDLETARGDYKAALAYFKKKDAYEDSSLNERNLAKISDLKIQYETEKKQQDLDLLTKEKQLQDLELAQSRTRIILLSGLFVFLVISILLYTSRKRYKLKEALAVEKEELQRTRFKAVIDAEEKERKRIAQELHDGLGQLLSTARITISGVGESGDPKVKNSLTLIDQSIGEVRNISHNLMPNALVSVGLKSALEDLVRKINLSDQVNVSLDFSGTLAFGEGEIISMYRIIQEVVNNALKYSESSKIYITVGSDAGETVITVKDEGKGFDTTRVSESKGIGWSNVYSRVALLSGEINIYSKLDQGTTVKIAIPNERAYNQAASS